MDIRERVISVLEEANEELIGYTGDNLFDDGILDSFQVMDIVNDLEEELDIEIDAKYVVEENFVTVDAIVALIEMIMNE